MEFNIQNFFSTNKRFFIWTVFFIILYLVRGLFGLIFITFILCFIFNNLIEWLNKKTRLPRRLWTIVIYIIFVTLAVTALASLGPKLGAESSSFLNQLPETLDNVNNYLTKKAENHPRLAPILDRLQKNLTIENLLGIKQETLVTFAVKAINSVTQYFSWLLIGTLFSFLILYDYPHLRAVILSMPRTRLKEVYEETADSVVHFALVVGATFQAQIMIAFVNTILTSIGLWGLNIHPIALLATMVFFAGLIPVLGVFISSVPILLVAFNSGGLSLIVWALVMIVFVHIVEAYILNPNIFAAVLKINPVLTLIILYIGHSLFGLWGVLLGVPVSVYIYRYTIMNNAPKSIKTQD